MDIVDINKRIKTEICYNSIEKLNDKNLLNEYKEYKSVKKKIIKLKQILEKHNIKNDKIELIINDYILDLVHPETKEIIRENKYLSKELNSNTINIYRLYANYNILKLNNLKEVIESKKFISIIYNTYYIYKKYGARSSKKVDYFHNEIKKELIKIFRDIDNFSIKLEFCVPSYNSSGKKKCDIVILKKEKPYIIFPVKIIMTNYKQNKNNSWENLTGELIHIKWANKNIKLIPINIFMNKTPYLNKNGIITKFENITINDINNYNILKKKDICYNIINYIINVKHINKINDKFSEIPQIISFNKNTKFISFNKILNHLI